MPSFHRTVTTRTEPVRRGAIRTIARVDDFFHGFEVTLEVKDGELTSAAATAHRHPWTTCPGALPSVAALGGQVAYAGVTMARAPRSTTCVHVNDLVWLASQQHADRRYEMEITPFEAVLVRDGARALSWQLHHWIISGGAFAGLGVGGAGWADALDALDATDVDRERREAVRVLRRGLLVAVGYYTLDWRSISRGTDVPREIMADTCHTFSDERVELTECIAATPDRRGRPR